MRSALLLGLITGLLLADGLPETSPVRTATAGAWFTRARGNHALSLNPANLGYYGDPLHLGWPPSTDPAPGETSPQDLYSVQLIASPDKKLVLQTQRAVYRRLGDSQPLAIVLTDSLYKLRVGSFIQRDRAEAFRDSLKTVGYPDAWIVAAAHAPVDHAPLPRVTMTLAGIGLYVRNNALYPQWINRQLFGGLDLVDPKDKERFLSVFPAEGWNLNLMAGISSLSFSVGHWGFSLLAPGIISSLNLPIAITDVLFHGVRFDQPRDLSDLELDLLAMAPLSIDYGRQLQVPLLAPSAGRLYAGAGLNLLLGLADAHLVPDHLFVKTTPDSVLISGKTRLLSNYHPNSLNRPVLGTGVSVDLGIAADIGSQLSLGLAVKDLFGSLAWPRRYTTVNEFSVRLSAEDIKDMSSDYDVHLDSLRHSYDQSDTTYVSGSGRTNYPSQLILGASWQVLHPLIVAASIAYTSGSDYLDHAPPRLSVGLEYTHVPAFPVYLGLAVGGRNGFSWGTGFSLNLGALQWNLGFGQHGGMFNAARGADLVTEMRLLF